MLTGWQEIEEARYYFGISGIVHTGWQTIENETYYFDGAGKLCTGWQIIDGQRYYFGEDGVLCVGFFSIGNDRYYTAPDGSLLTGWQEVPQGRIYIGNDGVIQFGWQEIEGVRYYLHPQTGAAAKGFTEIDGAVYFFDTTFAQVFGWQQIGESYHYFYDDGTMVTGWTDLGQHRYYFANNGVMLTGWQDIDGSTYYFKENGVMAIGQITLEGANYFFASSGKHVPLVNPWNPVPEDYAYNFVEFDSEGRMIDVSAYDALKQMVADGRKAGNPCSITEIYRTVDMQRYLWNRRKMAYMEEGYDAYTADMMTGWSVAIPGHSEHHLGLAVDFNREEDNTLRWVRKHCHEYGFIIRYPDGKLDVTGIAYEPWHFRYVGVELAQELKDLNLCLEEYMEMLTAQEKKKDPPA